jgi:hypothetical protein
MFLHAKAINVRLNDLESIMKEIAMINLSPVVWC